MKEQQNEARSIKRARGVFSILGVLIVILGQTIFYASPDVPGNGYSIPDVAVRGRCSSLRFQLDFSRTWFHAKVFFGAYPLMVQLAGSAPRALYQFWA